MTRKGTSHLFRPKPRHREQGKTKDDYEPVDSVPEGLVWKPRVGYSTGVHFTTLFSLGNVYKLIRTRATGEVKYFRLKNIPPATPKDVIDAEPTPLTQQRFHQGSQCWFVDTGARWYLCEVVERKKDPDRIAIRSVTGWDADRKSEWGYGELLEFPAKGDNQMFQRLRKLNARYR